MFMTDFQYKAIDRVLPENMTLEKAIAMDLLDKDFEEMFYVTEVSAKVVDCGSDAYTDILDDEWDLNEDLKLQRLLEMEKLNQDDIEQWNTFYIDIYDGYTEETTRHWYVAYALRNE